jgi:UDP-GlcNAc:undecaprenyl-phosphate GlcNAc-1-phosphate transferase
MPLDTTLLPLVLSLLASGLALSVLRALSVIDVPNERSLHDFPVPRGGGVGPALAGIVTVAVSPAFGALRPGLLAASAGFALLGLAEDLRGVPVAARLILQVVLGAGAMLLLPESGLALWGFVLGVVWIVGFANAFNFMDGIDGISVVQALVAGSTWAWVGWWLGDSGFAAAGAVVALAALGFLPFNFPRARMFLGDVGSYFFGAWLAGGAVWGILAGVAPEAVLAPLALYAADTGATLAGRIKRHEPWLRPHRDHAYQRLVAAGASHARVDLLVLLVMAGCSLLGLVSLSGSPGARLSAGAGICLLLVWYLATPRLVESQLARQV